jgi:hypothetical protein
LAITAGLLNGDAFTDPVIKDLRTIESAFDPIYQADQDLITWKGEWDVTDSLLLTYLGSHNESSVKSIEDYNKVAPTVRLQCRLVGRSVTQRWPAVYPAPVPRGSGVGSGTWGIEHVPDIRPIGRRQRSGHARNPPAVGLRRPVQLQSRRHQGGFRSNRSLRQYCGLLCAYRTR